MPHAMRSVALPIVGNDENGRLSHMAKARSFLASIVGYVLVAVVAYLAFRMFLGTVYWLLRTAIVIVAVGGLATLYLKLKAPSSKP
jgi:hypothetical protein